MLLLVHLAASVSLMALGQSAAWQPNLTRQQTYTMHRASSADPTGANADCRKVDSGETLTLLDTDGPGLISHLWFTIASKEPYHLKRIVLRIYWDGEETPSVEAPIGDFFGLGLGYYNPWQSEMLSVGSVKDLNCFFPMPFQRHARITVTNEGKQLIKALYYNIDYRTDPTTLAPGTLYFHAQYRQAQPNRGWTNRWTSNGQPLVNKKANLTGQDNYVWFDAKGSGQYAGVTMSILQNQNDWWGEGDDMFFVDGAKKPSIAGTGAEDYFLGAWGFKEHPFSYQLYGAPIVGKSEGRRQDRASTVFTLIRRSFSIHRSRRPSNTATQIIARTTSTPWPTGTRPSRMPLSLHCRPWSRGCPCWSTSVGRGTSRHRRRLPPLKQFRAARTIASAQIEIPAGSWRW